MLQSLSHRLVKFYLLWELSLDLSQIFSQTGDLLLQFDLLLVLVELELREFPLKGLLVADDEVIRGVQRRKVEGISLGFFWEEVVFEWDEGVSFARLGFFEHVEERGLVETQFQNLFFLCFGELFKLGELLLESSLILLIFWSKFWHLLTHHVNFSLALLSNFRDFNLLVKLLSIDACALIQNSLQSVCLHTNS